MISRWDFDNYNPANIVDALKPSAGTSGASIGIFNGSGASTAALAGIIGPAYLVDGSVAPGLAAGDYAIALPKGTHLKVPFPGGVIKSKHWTVRVRFFHPAASGGKPRAILQPALNNKGQYFYGLDAGNRLWIDHNNAPGKNYTGADGAENGFSAGNTPSRTPFITLKGDIKWTKLLGVGKFGVPRVTVCVGNSTLTFDRSPQVDSLAFESGFGNGRVNLNLAYLLDDYKTMSGIGELKVDKDVTLTLPTGVSLGGTLVLQKVATWAQTPVNYTTLRFKAPRGANYRIFAKEDGIYASSGIVVLLR